MQKHNINKSVCYEKYVVIDIKMIKILSSAIVCNLTLSSDVHTTMTTCLTHKLATIIKRHITLSTVQIPRSNPILIGTATLLAAWRQCTLFYCMDWPLNIWLRAQLLDDRAKQKNVLMLTAAKNTSYFKCLRRRRWTQNTPRWLTLRVFVIWEMCPCNLSRGNNKHNF